jgi:uncharacterized membrane protein
MKRFVGYFLQGLLLLAPIAVTVYVIFILARWFDQLWIDKVLDKQIPGLGAVITILVIALFGYMSSSLIFKPVFSAVERLIIRTPLIKIIYTSVKDLFKAFVSNEKKFDKPVLVRMDKDSNLYKLGFMTQSDLAKIGVSDMVAVYLPHSYAWSGNMFLVPPEQVQELKGISASEAMKFIISGGVTALDKKEE